MRRAKAKAAERGISLHQFVAEAVEEKLGAASPVGDKPWLAMVGGLRNLRKENARIQRLIDQEFERIGPEDRL